MKRILLILFGVSLVVRALTAWSLDHPGYFDAFYYYHLAENMATGQGLTENLIWNYLDDPTTLPRPGAQYWMPMAAFWAWLGMVTFGFLDSWRAAQLPFVIFGSLLPPLSAWIAWQAWGKRSWAVISGVLTLFSGFYFVYWVVPDNFLPFALTTALCFLGLAKATQPDASDTNRYWFIAGVGAGLSHLTRIDGVLLVLLVAGFWLFRPRKRFNEGVAASLGYLLVMAPWFLRNYLVAGTVLPGGGLQTLWLTSYNEIFAYNPQLTLARYWEWGIGNILLSKVRSAWTCALIILGATLFYMAPLVMVALRKAYRLPLFRPVLWYSVLLLTVMPLIFTFPATRGSLFHSSAALVAWYMALVPYGLARTIDFVAARRHTWNARQANQVFGVGFAVLAVLITLSIYAGAVWLPADSDAALARWRERTQPYPDVAAWMAENAPSDALIFVDEPPLYTGTTGQPSLAIPSDGIAPLTRAALAWDAHYFLLDFDNAQPYRTMYDEQQGEGAWEFVTTFTDGLNRPMVLFRYAP
jgi:hypothetical protein